MRSPSLRLDEADVAGEPLRAAAACIAAVSVRFIFSKFLASSAAVAWFLSEPLSPDPTWLPPVAPTGMVIERVPVCAALLRIIVLVGDRRSPPNMPFEPGAVLLHLDQRRREIIGDRLALLLVGRAEQPQQQEERHHRGHEIGIGDLPRAAMMAAMPLDIDLLDDDLAAAGCCRAERAPRPWLSGPAGRRTRRRRPAGCCARCPSARPRSPAAADGRGARR